MSITNTLKTGLRAGVVAIALAGSTLAMTAPVQAQSNPSFGFSLNFGNGGQLLAHLDDAVFNHGFLGLDEGSYDGANIHATFTLMSAAVPEPATWAMMILGMGMVGAGLRLRRRQTVSAAA